MKSHISHVQWKKNGQIILMIAVLIGILSHKAFADDGDSDTEEVQRLGNCEPGVEREIVHVPVTAENQINWFDVDPDKCTVIVVDIDDAASVASSDTSKRDGFTFGPSVGVTLVEDTLPNLSGGITLGHGLTRKWSFDGSFRLGYGACKGLYIDSGAALMRRVIDDGLRVGVGAQLSNCVDNNPFGKERVKERFVGGSFLMDYHWENGFWVGLSANFGADFQPAPGKIEKSFAMWMVSPRFGWQFGK